MIYTHKDVFRILFYSGDYLCFGDAYATGVAPQPDGVYEFFSINPLHPTFDYHKMPNGSIERVNARRRADLNVTRFQNFLFEMDNVPLEEQLSIFTALEVEHKIPFASIVYSGGKSYHGIISLEFPLEVTPHTSEALQTYKDTWNTIAHHLSKLVGASDNLFDTACQNPSRLSRFPTFQADGRERQDVISIGRLMNQVEFQSIMNSGSYTPTQPRSYRVVRASDATNTEELRMMIPAELDARLKYPWYWAKGEAGNYPELFKLVLWLYDSTGATRDMVVEYMQKHTIPKLTAMGYPEDKVYKAIDDAFSLKGE